MSVRTLKNEDLLIDQAEPGYVVTAEDWLTTMENIRDVVNNNAAAIKENTIQPFVQEIYNTLETLTPNWDYDTVTGKYVFYIPRDTIGKSEFTQIRFYNKEGVEVGCGFQDDKANNRVVITSRFNGNIKVVIV